MTLHEINKVRPLPPDWSPWSIAMMLEEIPFDTGVKYPLWTTSNKNYILFVDKNDLVLRSLPDNLRTKLRLQFKTLAEAIDYIYRNIQT